MRDVGYSETEGYDECVEEKQFCLGVGIGLIEEREYRVLAEFHVDGENCHKMATVDEIYQKNRELFELASLESLAGNDQAILLNITTLIALSENWECTLEPDREIDQHPAQVTVENIPVVIFLVLVTLDDGSSIQMDGVGERGSSSQVSEIPGKEFQAGGVAEVTDIGEKRVLDKYVVSYDREDSVASNLDE